jgi:hypothetical protein
VESSDVKGVGDDAPGELHHYVASEVRIGDVVFANYPVSIFRPARSSEADGLIGADVFQRFLVSIDFPKLELDLTPRANPEASPDELAEAADKPPEGFQRTPRAGSHLSISTFVNEEGPRFFLIDSGSSANLLDVSAARDYTSVSSGAFSVRGVQGKVKETSLANRVALTFAGFRQENSSVIAFDFDKISDSQGFALAGVIGLPILEHLRVSIDYREGNIRFEKGK